MGKYLRKVSHTSKLRSQLKWILPLIAIFLLGIVGFLLFSTSSETQNNLPSTDARPASIAIPGYEIITLEADKKKQDLVFSNPAINECLFVISLQLEDGTELWRSEEIEPGKTSKKVVLSQALAEGNYPNAVLQYSCYMNNSQRTKLNGASTKLTLSVK